MCRQTVTAEFLIWLSSVCSCVNVRFSNLDRQRCPFVVIKMAMRRPLYHRYILLLFISSTADE